MKPNKPWIQIRDELSKSVAYINGNSGRRAFDAVVVEIRKANLPWEQEPRRVVLKTSGTLHPEIDVPRLRRMCRRLSRLGVKFNTSLGDIRNTGVRGTIFAHTA